MSCKHKVKLRTFSMNNVSPTWKALCIKCSNILKKVTREAKKQHYSRLTAKSDTKMKTAWILWRKRQKKVQSVEQMPSSLTNKEKYMNAQNLASAMKNVLLTMTHKLNIHQVQKEYAIWFLKPRFPGNFLSIKITRVTEAEINV